MADAFKFIVRGAMIAVLLTAVATVVISFFQLAIPAGNLAFLSNALGFAYTLASFYLGSTWILQVWTAMIAIDFTLLTVGFVAQGVQWCLKIWS